ncbi:hypothetical protein GE061_019468 [Apolygus lucorum]|uniref:Uncharacterized protein n=1 Tax=Apolygus lucorum TaxID=248454 RepID=A0A6A4JJ21_APOLU|nr:hypothetical protein GE061_019468 [Apolygus lucorum]
MRIKRSCKPLQRVLRTLARRLSNPAAGPRNAKQLTPEEVATILRANEFSKELEENPVINGYYSNCLAANITMEDRSAEAKILSSEASMFAVYDGHAGHMCAEVLSRKLFPYIATALLPAEGRNKLFYSRESQDTKLVEMYRHGKQILSEDVIGVFDELRTDWVDKLRRTKQIFTREDCLTKAFLRMDADLGKAAETDTMTQEGSTYTMLEAAMSGAVACVALIEGSDLYVAGTGDCGAVLGRQKKNGRWTALKLNSEHTASNKKEVDRMKSEHPDDEAKTIIQQNRLFGSLMPLRAFGDFRYKWPVDTLERVAAPTYGRQVISANYRTPPYLTASPDVVHRKITSEDKFLVLATDGLWDVLSPDMVVQLVGDHKNRLPSTLRIKKGYYERVFPQRCVQEFVTLSPSEFYDNPSTYLLRAALGGSLDLVNRQLAVPLGEARNIRDDITVTVIFLKSAGKDEADNQNTKAGMQRNVTETHVEQDPTESVSPKVNEPPKDKGGSMAHSTKWEDIETGGSDDGVACSLKDLDAAVGSGGIIGKKSFKIKGDQIREAGHPTRTTGDSTRINTKHSRASNDFSGTADNSPNTTMGLQWTPDDTARRTTDLTQNNADPTSTNTGGDFSDTIKIPGPDPIKAREELPGENK